MATSDNHVMVVAIDDSEQSCYALEWALDHFFTPYAPNFPFKIVIVHAKPTPVSAIGFIGPGSGAADFIPHVDTDLKNIASRVVQKAKDICLAKLEGFDSFMEITGYTSHIETEFGQILQHELRFSKTFSPWFNGIIGMNWPKNDCERINNYVTEVEIEVVEGDARNVLCEAVERHEAAMLVVGSHGYGAIKRAVLGSVSDYCAHHAHCSVMIVKKPKIKH